MSRPCVMLTTPWGLVCPGPTAPALVTLQTGLSKTANQSLSKDLMLTYLGDTLCDTYLLVLVFNQMIKELLVLLASVSMSWCFRPSSTFTFAKTESEESLTESLVLQAILLLSCSPISVSVIFFTPVLESHHMCE